MGNKTIILCITFLALALSPIFGRAETKEPAEKKGPAETKDIDEATCKALVKPSPDPAPVDEAKLLSALKEVKTLDGKVLVAYGDKFEQETKETFDVEKVKTKTEQFYRLLNVIYQHLNPELPRVIKIDPVPVRKVLVASKIFYDSVIPDEIRNVTLDQSRKKDPRYEVEFATDETRLPLNRGKGFYAYTHGFCQHSTALVFYKKFSFSLRKKDNENILARYFRGVDLFGTFGTRVVFDIDFQYVGLKEVEFYRGTKVGNVTAQLSPMEFKRNDHNPLLRIITKFVSNSNVSSLGW